LASASLDPTGRSALRHVVFPCQACGLLENMKTK
jgi:hypothetical protein